VLPPVLLDGVLTTPDEACGRGGGAFGAVQSVRVAETGAAAQLAANVARQYEAQIGLTPAVYVCVPSGGATLESTTDTSREQ
jgi:galactokinase